MSTALNTDVNDSIELLKCIPPSGGEWQNSPSASAAEIELEMYLRTARLKFHVLETSYPYTTAAHISTSTAATATATAAAASSERHVIDLPAIRYDVDVIPYHRAIGWLQENACDIDEHRTGEEIAEIAAYKSLIHNDLIPAVQYIEWADSSTYHSVTRKTYAENVPWIVRQYLLRRKRRQVLQQLADRGIDSLDTAISLIENVYKSLSTRLGIRRTFFDKKRPSTLDICIASQIAVQVHAPWPQHIPVRNLLLKKHSRLVKHSKNLMIDLWPTIPVSDITSPIKALTADSPDIIEQYPQVKELPAKKSQIQRPAAVLNARAAANRSDDADADADLDLRTSEEIETMRVQRNNRLIFFTVFAAFAGYVGFQRYRAQQPTA